VTSRCLKRLVKNLSRYHREHEKYYSEAPLADAIALQRTARTLIALAKRWASVEPAAEPAPSPFAGTPDLNDDRAIETSGVLFMEGEGEPAEITRIKSELGTIAASSEQSGSWLAAAMDQLPGESSYRPSPAPSGSAAPAATTSGPMSRSCPTCRLLPTS
jgi:hypothetical protein